MPQVSLHCLNSEFCLLAFRLPRLWKIRLFHACIIQNFPFVLSACACWLIRLPKKKAGKLLYSLKHSLPLIAPVWKCRHSLDQETHVHPTTFVRKSNFFCLFANMDYVIWHPSPPNNIIKNCQWTKILGEIFFLQSLPGEKSLARWLKLGQQRVGEPGAVAKCQVIFFLVS